MLRESGPIEGYHDLYSFNNPTLVLYSPETRNIFSEKKTGGGGSTGFHVSYSELHMYSEIRLKF